MSKINLLPKEFTPKKSIIKISSILMKVSYVSVLILFISIIIIVVLFILNLTKLNKLKEEEAKLAYSVKSYEQTEQQITLAKDRMSIIKDIWSIKDVNNTLDVFEKTLLFMDEKMLLKNADLSSATSEFSLESASANSVAKFMGNLVTSDLYSSVILKNFSFNPNYGYRISLEGVIK